MDLVYRVVQIGQTVAYEHIGWQGVEDASGRVEGAVDERPHPARLYTLVDGVDGHETSGVRPFVRPGIIDDLDIPRDYLNAVAALDLAGGDHPNVGEQLVQKPAPAPDRNGDVSRAVVDLSREARGATSDGFADGARRDDRAEDRGPLPHAQLGDPLHVGQVLVARWVVRDHVGQRGYAEVAEHGLDPRFDAGKFGHGPRTKVRQGRPCEQRSPAGPIGGQRHRLQGLRGTRRPPRFQR